MCLLVSVVVAGASCVPPFRHIGLKEGLSNSFILDMAVDGQGFIWLATESGLNRIAGENVTVFKKDNSGLVSDNLRSICYVEDRNELWISTRLDGISVYNCGTGVFRSIRKSDGLLSDAVIDVAMSADGGIWILHYHGGLQYVSPDGDISTIDVVIPEWTKCCFDDGNNHVYVGHNSVGLSVVDVVKKTVKRYMHDSSDRYTLPSNLVRCVYKDSKGNVWIGTNNGLSRFDPVREVFYNYGGRLAGDNVMSIMESEDGFLWVSSDPGGISRIEISGYRGFPGEDIVVDRITMENSPLSSPNTRAVIEDGYRNKWIANYSTGVDFIPGQLPAFRALPCSGEDGIGSLKSKVYGVAVSSDGSLWFGGEGVLSKYELGKGIDSYDVYLRKGRRKSVVRTVRQDSRGKVWLGTFDSGAQLFDPETGMSEFVDLGEDYLDVWAFCEDARGRMWIGTENGVFFWHDGIVEKGDSVNYRLSGGVVASIMRDSNGRMWVGMLGGGVDVFEEDGNYSHNVRGLPSSEINHIIEDSNEDVWIATYDGVVKVSGDSVVVYGWGDGLTDTHIRGLAEDRFGNLWMSTYSGISCLDKSSGTIHNYDFNDGVPMGGFVEGSAAVLPDGAICFGSPEGVCMFNPHSLKELSPVSPIEVIDVARLEYDSFKVSFSVRNFAQVGNVEYAYMLEGIDEKWHSTEGESYVLARNLPPGKYVLHLNVKDKNGGWDKAGIISIPLEVEPKLWQTWWAKLLYILLFAGCVAVIVHAYNRHLFLKKSLKLRQESLEIEKRRRRDEQELNNERLGFYTNIAHELRTPLTLIVGPLEDLKKDSAFPEKYRRRVALIHDNALRLLGLINQIMEFRKTETQHRQLVVAKGNPGNMVKEIGLRYRELNRNENLEINVIVGDVPSIYFDYDVVVTIMNNLISNAVKYTSEGEVAIGMKVGNRDGLDAVDFYVTDTGMGISEDELPYIFDSYYRAGNGKHVSGTGIGLALVKRLVELHKGVLTVESEYGKGSSFVFSLFVDESYPEYPHKELKSVDAMLRDENPEDNECADMEESVLVVEDNEDIRKYIVDSLRETYVVIEAADGKDGFEKAVRDMPSLIVSDVMMPGIDGFEMCHGLKTDIRTCHIPVILLTAKDSIADKETGYENGADSYITKPFSAGLLKKRIRNILTMRQMLAAQILAGKAKTNSSGEVFDNEDPNDKGNPVISNLDKAFLKKLETLFEDNIQEEKVDMTFFTDKMNMSYSAFYRKVKALTGMSPVDYFKKYKVRYSCELLVTGDYGVSEIAMMIGVSSSYFHRIFKKETGMTPTEYIQMHCRI